jgi:hypothetical protein
METKTKRKPLKYIVLGILLCAAVGAGCYFLGRAGTKTDTRLSAVAVESRLEGVSELASVSYSYTNMAKFENSEEFYGVKLPFTTKSFILTYDGVIKAGVDLKDVKVAVAGQTVTVTLPKAKILSHEIEEDSVKIFDEKTSVFNPFTVEDFTAFQSAQKTVMEQKAKERDLLGQAQKKAADSVKLLLKPALPDGWTLKVV